MGGNYGLAQSQAEAEAAAAVGNFGSCRIKHIKYMFLGLVGYPVTVVRYRYNSQIPLLFVSITTSEPGSVFNGIIYKIYDNLHDKSCICFYEKKIFFLLYLNLMLTPPPVRMAQRLADHFVEKPVASLSFIIVPSSIRVTDNKFSTRLISQESS